MSIEQLVADAEVPRSTFYVYFSDKSAVFREVLDEFVEFTVQTILDTPDPSKLTRDALLTVMQAGVCHYLSRRATYHLLANAAASDPAMAQTYRIAMDRMSDVLASRIARWGDRSRPTLRARTLASALTWMLERTLHQETDVCPPAQQARLAEALTTIVWSVAVAEREMAEQRK